MVQSATIGTDMKDEISKEGNISPDWLREFQKPMQSTVQLSLSSPSTSLSLDDREKGKATISALQSSQLEINEYTSGPSDRHGVVLLTDSDEEAPRRIQSSEIKALNDGENGSSKIPNAKRNMHPDSFGTNLATLDKKSPDDGVVKGKKKDAKDQKSSVSKKRRAVIVTGQIKEQYQQRQEPKFSLEDKKAAEPKLSLEDKKAAEISVARHGDSKLSLLQEGNDDDDDLSSLPGAMKGEDEAKLQQKKSIPLNKEPMHEDEIAEEQDRRQRPRIASSLPLVFSDKVHTSKVLVECEGSALDLSGDIGAVGRFSANRADEKDSYELLLDLKGIVYKAAIVPSNTFFVVNMGSSEAKVEAIMNDFLQLHPHTNANENETMIEGTLEGLMFESEDEADRRKIVSESGVDPDHKIVPKSSMKKLSGPVSIKKKAGGNLSKAKDKIAGTKAKASKKPIQKKSTKASASRNFKVRK